MIAAAIPICQFFAPGEPVTQGSTKAFLPKGWKRPIVTHDKSKELKDWRARIAAFAFQGMQTPPVDYAVMLVVRFVLPRPPSVSVKKRPLPTAKPDLDKLVRALKDGMTGVVYRDDAQVTRTDARKRYGERPGVHVSVYQDVYHDEGEPDDE